jgi:hypothetical protein
MGFRSSQADPDVWLRPARKPGGEKYYEYVLCYVDDVLAISTSPDLIMKSIQERFKLKGDKYGPPTSYLGAQLSKMTIVNGTECWTQSSDKYIEESVKTVQEFLRSKRSYQRDCERRCFPITNPNWILPQNWRPRDTHTIKS